MPFARLAELGKLEPVLDFLVLLRVIIHLFALGALELDEGFLGHTRGNDGAILPERARTVK